jgi:hypothetical protein
MHLARYTDFGGGVLAKTMEEQPKAAMDRDARGKIGHIPTKWTATNGPRRDPHLAHEATLPGPRAPFGEKTLFIPFLKSVPHHR